MKNTVGVIVGINPSYTYIKDGIFYYSRVVPKDLKSHYVKNKIVMSLRTKSSHKASIAASTVTSKLDAYWLTLRLSQMDVPAAHLLTANQSNKTKVISFSDAKNLYVKTKGTGRSKTFFTSADRNASYLIDCLGNRSLDMYLSSDAGTLRDWLLKRSLSISSVRRVFTTIKAIFNLAVGELGLDINNPFTGVFIPNQTINEHRRIPLSNKAIKELQSQCKLIDDDMRWLLALISDTGMRLSEATGLVVQDIHLDEQVPFVLVRPHEWRSLKTSSSIRTIPLVGASLWAAKRIVESSKCNFCFPRYCNLDKCNSNSASAALNKWLKQVAGNYATVHGLRHSMRDRLREVDAPTDLIDQIGGWTLSSIGQTYGNGYALKKIHIWLEKIAY